MLCEAMAFGALLPGAQPLESAPTWTAAAAMCNLKDPTISDACPPESLPAACAAKDPGLAAGRQARHPLRGAGPGSPCPRAWVA